MAIIKTMNGEKSNFHISAINIKPNCIKKINPNSLVFISYLVINYRIYNQNNTIYLPLYG